MNLTHFFSKLDSKSNKHNLTSYIIIVSYILLFISIVLANGTVYSLKRQLSITHEKIERYQSYILSQIKNPFNAKESFIVEYISDIDSSLFKAFIPQSVCIPCAISLFNTLIEGNVPTSSISIYFDKYNPAVYNEAKMRSINNLVLLDNLDTEGISDIILIRESSNQVTKDYLKYKDGFQEILNEFIIEVE